ncbi:MAG: FMN-dependent oxidoreductase (nitrilotriacetate monooxygenase family) [Paracoccaceae bacterium]|jgi:FMN-dependent oxidoreductase (nitrilotriacetate monooxygenase family)
MAEMKLGLFIRPTGHHIASWRHPDAHDDANVNFDRFVEMAKTAERGLLDMLFSADTNTAWTTADSALNRQHYSAWLEPFTLLTALATHTKHIGLVCTRSTSFDQPYTVARMFATLDLISGGRAGVNIVTTGNPRAALNYNQESHLPKSERYAIADEFVEVLKGLWDSWDEDAFVRDRESGTFFEWDRMHVLNHKGKYFQVEGPLNTARSPQGRPVIVQAGASEEGRELAAKSADVIFAAHQNIEMAQAFYTDVKSRLARYGRQNSDVAIMPGLSVTVAETREEAQAKADELQELIHPDHGLAYLSRRLGHDVTGMDPDLPMPDLAAVDEVGTRSGQMLNMARREGWTLRQLYQHFAATRGHMDLVGTPTEVADGMQEWFENGACDGFNLIPPTFPGEFDAFVDMVVPELQRRGVYRTAYEDGTLRDRLGLRVPESRYAAGTEAAE